VLHQLARQVFDEAGLTAVAVIAEHRALAAVLSNEWPVASPGFVGRAIWARVQPRAMRRRRSAGERMGRPSRCPRSW
jgi:hypothetical protein